MLFENLVIPMRAQPFHKEHMHLLRVMKKYCNRGVVVLCRDYDNNCNPFSFDIRAQWICQFLIDECIANLSVPNRLSDVRLNRSAEYSKFFDEDCTVNDITVLTTYETDQMYRADGFHTCNHHADDFLQSIWSKYS